MEEISFENASHILANFVALVMRDIGELYERDWWEPLTNPKVAKADEDLALDTFESISPTVEDYLGDIKVRKPQALFLHWNSVNNQAARARRKMVSNCGDCPTFDSPGPP